MIAPPLVGLIRALIFIKIFSFLILFFTSLYRVLAAYLHVARAVYNVDLLFVWDVNVECPGHFLEIFQPIEGVSFISNSSRYAMEPYAKAVFPNVCSRFEIIMEDNGFKKYTWRGHETESYKNFIPTREILQNIDSFFIEKNVQNFSSMHLRQTDMHAILKPKQRLAEESYDRFIDTRPVSEKIYLLSDNPVGQKRFLDKYGDRIIVYKKIEMPSHLDDHRHVGEYWNTDQIEDKTRNETLPVSYRFTSLQHTLIDVIISSRSAIFKGSPFSSLTDLVVRFRRVIEVTEKAKLNKNIKTLK